MNDSNLSAFGDIINVSPTPVFQSDFVYGLNNQIWSTAVVSGTGAAVDTNASRLRVQSGTANNGYAYLTSRKILKYRAGSGMLARFTTAFSAAEVSSTQLVGVGAIASNVPTDGYFVGYSGATFGIFHYVRGSATFIPQSSWNGNTLDGAEGVNAGDFTKGQVWQIIYPYLGYGAIRFYCLNQHGQWILVHTIQYPNTTAATQLANPNLQFLAFTLNTGATANKIIYVGSVGVFITGERSLVSSPQRAADSTKAGITAETNLLSIRNATTYNGVTNRSLIKLRSIHFGSTQNSGVCVMRITIGATLGGTPSFAAVSGTTADDGVTITSGQSIASVDAAGTTLTNGTRIYSVYVSHNAAVAATDLQDYDVFIAPGETATISVESSTSSTIGLSANWVEEI